LDAHSKFIAPSVRALLESAYEQCLACELSLESRQNIFGWDYRFSFVLATDDGVITRQDLQNAARCFAIPTEGG
jgi:hypothetical protein